MPFALNARTRYTHWPAVTVCENVVTFAPTLPTAVNDSVLAFTARSIENPVSLLDGSVQRSVTNRFAPAVAVRLVGAAGSAGPTR